MIQNRTNATATAFFQTGCAPVLNGAGTVDRHRGLDHRMRWSSPRCLGKRSTVVAKSYPVGGSPSRLPSEPSPEGTRWLDAAARAGGPAAALWAALAVQRPLDN